VRIRYLLAVLSLCTVAAKPAASQSIWLGENAELGSLYEKVIADPSNVDRSIEYAQRAKAVGDYEAAISAYERLLLFNPRLPQLQYELGVLYFQLESYAAARTYFEASLAGGAAPDLRDNVKLYLAEIERRLSPDRLTGYFHAGLRYQSNATAGPGGGLIRFGGQDAILDSSFAGRPDWNAFALLGLLYEHDFGNGRGDTFEAALVSYYAKQFKETRVDLGAVEVQLGPRLTVLPELMAGVSVKPYLIVNGLSLGDHPYFSTLGTGISLRSKINPVTVFESALEYRARKFYDSSNYPTAAQQTGDLLSYTAAGTGLVAGPVRWIARLGYDWNRADFDFWSYDRPNIDVGWPINFEVDWGGYKKSWLVTPYVGASMTRYAMPNPTYDPLVKRRDREWHVGTMLEAQIFGNAGVRINVQYLRNESNLPNFTFRNLSVSLGPAVRF
jgi:tetratricopeptide (TPR) repeat protein